jgi:hypothetical protein
LPIGKLPIGKLPIGKLIDTANRWTDDEDQVP